MLRVFKAKFWTIVSALRTLTPQVVASRTMVSNTIHVLVGPQQGLSLSPRLAQPPLGAQTGTLNLTHQEQIPRFPSLI